MQGKNETSTLKRQGAVFPMSDQEIIGDYLLGRQLGTGTFGKVRVATHIPTNCTVAIKILSKSKITQMNMWSKVEREIMIMKMARHPHIINLYEVIYREDDIYLVMEYAEGGELFSYIVKHKRLDSTTARKFFQQIISALSYLHIKVSVTHRDLKPENILLTKNKLIKLSDFGLSNVMSEGEFLKTSCGSPNYASPEVVAGTLYIGPATDIWSAGCVLYTLLVGRLPFDDHYMPALFRKIKTGEYVIPDYVDSGAADMLRGMMTVDVDKRFTIDIIRAHPWFTVNLPKHLLISFDSDPSDREEELRTTDQGQRIVDMYNALNRQSTVDDIKRKFKAGQTDSDTVCYQLIHDHIFDEIIARSFGIIGEPESNPAGANRSIFDSSSLSVLGNVASGGSGDHEEDAMDPSGPVISQNPFAPPEAVAPAKGPLLPSQEHEFSGLVFNTYVRTLPPTLNPEASLSPNARKVDGAEAVSSNTDDGCYNDQTKVASGGLTLAQFRDGLNGSLRSEKVDKKSMFYFGVTGCNIAVMPPPDMMCLILETMRELGFKWRIGGLNASKYYDSNIGRDTVVLKTDTSKKRNNFCVAFKLVNPASAIQNDLIIGLTLYIAIDQSNHANYVVDLRMITGELNLFLHYAQRIGQAITEHFRAG